MRKTARGQHLPECEVVYLVDLDPQHLRERVRDLFNAGWPLRAIQEALPRNRRRSRSAIYNWIYETTTPSTDTTPIPTPTSHEYVPRRVPSPGIPATDQSQLTYLAQQARLFRSKHPLNHPYALANQQLTILVTSLYEKGVRIQELADAARVSYRAMYKRIKPSR